MFQAVPGRTRLPGVPDLSLAVRLRAGPAAASIELAKGRNHRLAKTVQRTLDALVIEVAEVHLQEKMASAGRRAARRPARQHLRRRQSGCPSSAHNRYPPPPNARGRSRASKGPGRPEVGRIESLARRHHVAARQHVGGDEFVLGEAELTPSTSADLCGSISSCLLPPGEGWRRAISSFPAATRTTTTPAEVLGPAVSSTSA